MGKIDELDEELEYLEKKRYERGWDQKDADRYHYLHSLREKWENRGYIKQIKEQQ